MNFNERIRALREDNDYTQEQIGNKIGLSQRKISRLERGETNPTIQEIRLFCLYYNKSADYILGFTDEAKPLPKR